LLFGGGGPLLAQERFKYDWPGEQNSFAKPDCRDAPLPYVIVEGPAADSQSRE
jgi:hypothetical protein